MTIRAAVLAGLAVAAVAVDARAQDPPLRAGMLGSPRAGRPAPPLVLPFLTPAGPGSADQSFRLEAELGKVVVLVFGGRPDSTRLAGWREVAARADSASGPLLVVAGVVAGEAGAVANLAAGLGGGIKLLIDAQGRAHRAYGMGPTTSGWAVWIVGDDGVLVWGGRLDPRSRSWWREVEAAAKRGRTRP